MRKGLGGKRTTGAVAATPANKGSKEQPDFAVSKLPLAPGDANTLVKKGPPRSGRNLSSLGMENINLFLRYFTDYQP
jgi:hypothetical protein